MKKELKRKARPPGRADPSGKKIQNKKALRTRRSGSKRKQKNPLSGMLAKISGTVKEKLQTMNVRKVLITNIPYFIVFYMVEKEAWLYRHCTGDSMVKKLMNVFLYFGLPFKDPFPSFHWWDLMVGVIGAAAFKGVIWYRRKNAKKYRQGEEYGSARWSA